MVLFIGYFVFKCYDFIPLKKKNTSKAKLLNYREITGVNKKSIYDYQCIRKKKLALENKSIKK